MTELVFRVRSAPDLKIMFRRAWDAGCAMHREFELVIREPKRSLDQNAKLWPMLSDISRQIDWPVDGRLQKLQPEDWKHIFTSQLTRETRVAQGIDGGFVVLGVSTRRMSRGEFSDLIELIYAFGARYQVRWSEPALKLYEEMASRRAA